VRRTEFAGEPASGRVFESSLLPGIADAVGSRRVRIDAIARWLQDVAYLDIVDAGFADRGIWVVRRSRIRVDGFPRFGEPVTLRTWCSGIGRFSAERRTTVTGSDARVEAVALWIWIDAESLRPRRFPAEFVDVYGESAAGRDAAVRLRHPDPPDDARRSAWRFRAADIDVAGHVNNASYLAPIEEDLAGEEPERLDLEIEYREPAQAGEIALLRAAERLWLVADGGPVYASFLLGDPALS
jgi:acyl-ACP thioesterase